MTDLKPKDLTMTPRMAELNGLGYSDGISSNIPRHPGSTVYMDGWETGYQELYDECKNETGEEPNA